MKKLLVLLLVGLALDVPAVASAEFECPFSIRSQKAYDLKLALTLGYPKEASSFDYYVYGDCKGYASGFVVGQAMVYEVQGNMNLAGVPQGALWEAVVKYIEDHPEVAGWPASYAVAHALRPFSTKPQ